MTLGQTATVTVTMRNTGTTTWETTVENDGDVLVRTSYSLGSVGWGSSGLAVTGSVAPNTDRAFEFTITAPQTAGSYAFQWRMRCDVDEIPVPEIPPPMSVASVCGWFGASTPSRTIVVEADTAPSFGGETISSMGWRVGETITPVELPEATGGNGTLTYAVTTLPAGTTLPGGVAFDPLTRVLSGTPTGWTPTRRADYTATDADGDEASLTFWFRVARDKKPSLSGTIPDLTLQEDETMSPVTLPAATGGDPPLTYSLPGLPEGLALDPLTRVLSGTPTVAQDDVTYTYTATDSDNTAPDSASLSFDIAVAEDKVPTFDGAEILDQTLQVGESFSLPLPAATGGDGTLTYSLSDCPAGTSFNRFTRVLSGTPTTAQEDVTYTYTATDSDVTEPDSVSLSFKVTVKPDEVPTFDEPILDQTLQVGESFSLTLPAATGGDGTLTYSLSGGLPPGVTRSGFTVSGTPTAAQSAKTYTWRVTDSDVTSPDSDSDSFKITVEPDNVPALTDPIEDQLWKVGEPVSLTLPGATGGDPPLSYSLTGTLPSGVTRSGFVVSGTPTAAQDAVTHFWRVTDSDATSPDWDLDLLTITVEADNVPSFGDEIPDQTWQVGESVSVTLPEATGGDGTLSHSLSGELPAGVTRSGFTVSGTPTAVQDAETHTWTATDSDAASPDSASLTFTITVEADNVPSFGDETIADQTWKVGAPVSLTLPEATGGDGTLSHSLSGELPAGVTRSGFTVSGTPTAAQDAETHTWTATDSDAASPDSTSLTFTITVEADNVPSFGDETIADQTWKVGAPVSVTLPEAAGGDGTLSHSLSGELPAGVTRSGFTVSGTPTAAQDAETYTWTATDSDAASPDSASLTFRITVDTYESSVQDYDLPTSMRAGTSANVSVTMKNTGSSTWTNAAGYGLGSHNAHWGITEVPLPASASVGTNVEQPFTFTITAPSRPGSYAFNWQMNQGGSWFGGIINVPITVYADDASFVSYRGLPPSMIVGETATVGVTMRNTGASTWTKVDGYKLVSQNTPSGLWGVTESALDASVAPDVDHTFYIAIAAPTTPGVHTFQWQMDRNGAGFGSTTTSQKITVYADNASLVSYDNVPTSMTAGDTATVGVTMRNTGTSTWTDADGYGLVSRTTPSGLWGLTAVPLPASASVAPDAKHTFIFTITAPTDPGDHTFQWQMDHNGTGFGGIVNVTITVAEDNVPSFGEQTIADQTWQVGEPVSVILPEAAGGDGTLSHSLSGELPAGVTRSGFTVSGTPTAAQDAVTYTWTATDSDAASPDSASLSFTITVAEDNVPSFGDETIADQTWQVGEPVSVTLPEATGGDGTLSHSLSGALPSGVTRSGFTVSGTPTAAQDAVTQTWTATDSDAASPDSASLTFTITVEADNVPSFGDETIADQTWQVGEPVSLTLPEATGGDGTLSHSLSGELPAGVTRSGFTVSGTPTAAQDAVTQTWTATDSDAASPDSASLTFTITVEADNVPSFGDETIADQTWQVGEPVSLTLPEATGGDPPLSYSLSGELPAGVTRSGFTVSGTPTAVQDAETYTWTATDSDAAAPDSTSLTFTITVEADNVPSFGVETIADQTWKVGEPVSLTLPEATGGDPALSYSLSGGLPAGVTRSGFTVSGTPTAAQDAVPHTWTATDSDAASPDSASLSFTITVAEDNVPSFNGTISDQTWKVGDYVVLFLRSATGGDGALSYSLSGELPAGVTRSGFVVSGRPTAAQDAVTYTWTATDSDAASPDSASLSFTIRVLGGNSTSFSGRIPDQRWKVGEPVSLQLLEATGGAPPLSYSLSGELPAGVTRSGFTVSGTPTAAREAAKHSWTATDSDAASPDSASLSFTIAVVAGAADDASFVSWSGVPKKMTAGSSATVTVTMTNTGTTTWTPGAGYMLGSQSPEDNDTWGLKRVGLPADAAPNATVDFTFKITAPETVGSYGFEWRMVRGRAAWFGSSTGSAEITVEDPSFGDQRVTDQTWVKDRPIAPLTLPAAQGGDGALRYSLTPSPPAGVTFTESTRTLSGTPTAVQTAAEYAYGATDIDGDAALVRFGIEVESAPADDASFVSWSGVPRKMAAGSSATVTVTMTNTGTTTWTPGAGYGLGSHSPEDNDTWGLTRVGLPADAAPNATVDFTFKITAPETAGSYGFAWRMVRDGAGWFGSSTGGAAITVEAPSFEDETIADRTWVQGQAIEKLRLPAARAGDGALTYSLTPSPPAGVAFDASTRTLSGTPTAVQGETAYTYAATDSDGDEATLSFEIEVEAGLVDDASFVSWSGVPSFMTPGQTAPVTVTMTNTGTTTWTSAAGYGLGSHYPRAWGLERVGLPAGVAPNATVDFTFQIKAPETAGSYGFEWQMVRDGSAWFGSSTGSAKITVEDPSFGGQTVTDQTWVKDQAIETLTLPAASGGDGALVYSLSPPPPSGVTFDASRRMLSGTPAAVQSGASYAYTATDSDGDAATLTFGITVALAASRASSQASSAPSAPPEVFDMFEYWLLPHGKASKVRTRLVDGRVVPGAGAFELRSFWRGELWGRKVALLGEPGGARYDLFEEVEGGLDYWGTYESGSPGAGFGGDAVSVSLDRPFRWMNRFMAVGDAVESPVTGRFLSDRRRNQAGVLEAAMRLEVVSHHGSFTIPAPGGLTFDDVLEVRFWPNVARAWAHDTFYLARGHGAVHSRRAATAVSGEVAEWWVVEKAPAPVAPFRPSVPWFDPFSPGWPKTAVVNGGLEDSGHEVQGGQVRMSAAPGWTADSSDAVIAPPPSGLDSGSRGLLLRGADGGGDGAPDAAVTEDWIPVRGGTYELSACMRRENPRDNVFVDFNDGVGRESEFQDAHLVAGSTGIWECRALTTCIPASVGAVRIRAARSGDNLGDAWFDRIEFKRIAACSEPANAKRRLRR